MNLKIRKFEKREPRLVGEVIRDLIELLDIMYQNPNETIASLLGSDDFVHAKPLEDEGGEPDVAPGYAEFTI